MSQRALYATRVVFLSLLFIPVTLAGLLVLGDQLTWLKVGIVVGIFAIADTLFIIVTTRKTAKQHADSSQSTH